MHNSFSQTRHVDILTLEDATVEDIDVFLRPTSWVLSLITINYLNHYEKPLGYLHKENEKVSTGTLVTRKHHIVKVNDDIDGAYEDEELDRKFLTD